MVTGTVGVRQLILQLGHGCASCPRLSARHRETTLTHFLSATPRDHILDLRTQVRYGRTVAAKSLWSAETWIPTRGRPPICRRDDCRERATDDVVQLCLGCGGRAQTGARQEAGALRRPGGLPSTQRERKRLRRRSAA
jgi:hypothetical protein